MNASDSGAATKVNCTILVALACEAKPLIDLCRLKKTREKPFAVFSGEYSGLMIEVVVSGIGGYAMASAVGWCAARGAENPYPHPRVWLNLGITGHGTRAIGEGYVVHCAADWLGSRKFYPPLIVKTPFDSDAQLSVNAPSEEYPAVGGVDMECFAFFSAANNFASSELVQSVKIVSDNPQHAAQRLNAALISDLIAPHGESIIDFLKSLVALVPMSPSVMHATRPDVHFTHSQKQQFDDLLRRLSALDCMDDALSQELANCKTAKASLELLKQHLCFVVPELSFELRD